MPTATILQETIDPTQLQALRKAADKAIEDHYRRSPRMFDFARKNVEPIDNLKNAKYRGRQIDMFISASIPVHTDPDLDPLSWLLYLGTVSQSAGYAHTVYLHPHTTDRQAIDRWETAQSVPDTIVTEALSLHLTPGTMFQLNIHNPHWLTATTPCGDIGDISPSRGWLDDIDPKFKAHRDADITGVFLAYGQRRSMPSTIFRQRLNRIAA